MGQHGRVWREFGLGRIVPGGVNRGRGGCGAPAGYRKIRANKGRDEAEILANLGKSAPVFELYQANGNLPQAEAAQILGITRQSVGYHLDNLEAQGAIKRNGHGVEVLV